MCKRLGFQRSVDWVHFNEIGLRGGSYWRDYIPDPNSLQYYRVFHWIVLPNLHCGDEARTIDECTYDRSNMTRISTRINDKPYIILSCDPSPG